MASPAAEAVVVGASVAGLLAAAALAPHCGDVLVLDRDRLPPAPAPRGGVPQARHAHVLLEPGCSAIETLMPGALHELTDAGAVLGDFQRLITTHVPTHAGLRPLATGDSGLRVLIVEREILEARLRARIAALPSVRLHTRASALRLVVARPARVRGVVVADLDRPARPARRVDAELVVDASGRGSRLPEPLASCGYPLPTPARQRIDGLHVTRRFVMTGTVRDEALPPRGGVVLGTSGRLDATAMLVHTDEAALIVSLAGYRGVRPPADLPGFTSYARASCAPIADLIENLQPIAGPVSYREPALLRRRFEQLSEPPAALVVIGDALCAVDAASGAGMSAAAMQAVALRDAVGAGGVGLGGVGMGAAGLPDRYYAQLRPLLDRLWDDALRRHAGPGLGPGTGSATRSGLG